MKFRTVAISVFLFGVFSLLGALVLNSSRRSPGLPEFVEATTAVTDRNFDDVVLASKKPVVLDFYGDYCTVCRQLEPKLAPVARQFADAVVFARVNIQQAPELVEQYDIQAVPTLVVLHQGERLFQGAGLAALPQVQSILEAVN